MAISNHKNKPTTGGNTMNKQKKSQSGQTLLIAILLFTILTTVGLSVVQNSIQQQQIAELEEQSKRAFSAAESGLEAALKRGEGASIDDIQLPGIKNISVTYPVEESAQYTTPIILGNGQFTFYMSSYNQADNTFSDPVLASQEYAFSPSDIDTATMCNSATTAFALELTYVNKETNSVYRRLIDPCSLIEGDVDTKWVFNVPASISEEAHFVILRIVGADSSFIGSGITITNPSGDTWIAQGKIIVSEAETTTGVVKRIKLYSTYPQIPTDFFVTSF